MCGRFNLLAEPERLSDHFQLRHPRDYQTSYNISPGQKIMTVVRLADNSRKAVNLWWGLVPSWARDRKIASRLINARSETVAEKPAFRAAFRKRRCLIPATGFYEWQRTNGHKQAYHIFRRDRAPFAFAGLWEHWERGLETVYSCTILTTAANALILPVHDRMPVVVSSDEYERWLGKETGADELQELLAVDAYQKFVVEPVSDWVNNPAHDDADCLN